MQEALLAESRAALSRESGARRRLHNQVRLPVAPRKQLYILLRPA